MRAASLAVQDGEDVKDGQFAQIQVFAGKRRNLPETPPTQLEFFWLASADSCALSSGCRKASVAMPGMAANRSCDTHAAQREESVAMPSVAANRSLLHSRRSRRPSVAMPSMAANRSIV